MWPSEVGSLKRGRRGRCFKIMSRTLVLALAPVVLIELGLLVSALVDLIRREPERVNGPKIVWGIVILVINIIGPIAYFLFGRKG